MSREIGHVYLHIGNSGLTLGVEDDGYGPLLHFRSSAFGNNVIDQRIHLDPNGIEALARLFAHAAAYDGYSLAYAHAAEMDSGAPCFLFDDLVPQRAGAAGADEGDPYDFDDKDETEPAGGQADEPEGDKPDVEQRFEFTIRNGLVRVERLT